LRNVDENFLFDLLTWPKARHPTPPRFFRERQPRNKSETIQNFLPVCTAFQDVKMGRVAIVVMRCSGGK